MSTLKLRPHPLGFKLPRLLTAGSSWCRLAADNSILVTMATCGGVPLAANWIRTIQALQVCIG